jgi:hypothetical protein
MNTNESYRLMVQVESGIVVVKVEAPTYYGARHGLETLAQLIVYDEIENTMKVGGLWDAWIILIFIGYYINVGLNCIFSDYKMSFCWTKNVRLNMRNVGLYCMLSDFQIPAETLFLTCKCKSEKLIFSPTFRIFRLPF